MPRFDPATTALVLIDLQHGIVAMDLAPRTGDETVTACTALARRFRAAGAPVVPVHVAFRPGEAPSRKVDSPMGGGDPSADWSDLVPGVRQEGDIVVLKHHWGAFTGTDLDLQLRRRGIRTVVIGGIATNFGVESTARSAWEHSYDVVIAEDCCASAKAELHEFAVKFIFPRISRVMTAGDIAFG